MLLGRSFPLAAPLAHPLAGTLTLISRWPVNERNTASATGRTADPRSPDVYIKTYLPCPCAHTDVVLHAPFAFPANRPLRSERRLTLLAIILRGVKHTSLVRAGA